ncbi:autotransporter outer membrane beta-barrel domain-containing protein [Salmonella enterica subsp. enterica]|nr:autotransporter outer membrane beta-barrel domain-containing protein [Salmonella enterica subsp. enterica]
MNRTYSIVWSAVRNMYVVASELARGHSKVKAQVCASETHSPNKKSEYGQIIKATRNVLACAVAAALGFFSPLAMADNQVSYADAQPHVLDASTPPMTYSGVEDGAALYVSGVATVGWQPTKVTGTGLVIETSGGGANNPDGGKYVSKAISIDHYAILDLTDTEITTDSIYSLGISAADGSELTLTDSSLKIDGNYGIMTLYTGSEATLEGTIVEAANSSSAQVQQGSTLNVLDGSTITLAQGQINVVAGTDAANAGSTLNLSDSSVSSTGTKDTIQGSNKADLNLTNATITHTNASGAAVRANNATTLDISGGNITSAGTGVYILASDARINDVTINADSDGIFITSKRKLDGYEDLNALTVSDANITSKTVALNVDGSTTINDPIKLTNSTFTAPTAIKLGSKATIQAENMTLTGNIVQTDASSSALSLEQGSTLTGSVDAMFTTLSLDDTSQWNMTDPSTVGNLTNDGGITLNNASGSTGTLLTVDNTLTLQDGSQINATLDTANSSPIIKAANVTLDGTLNLSSTATFVAPETDEHFGSVTLIDSQTAITTDFDSVTLDADTSAMPDYLTINAGVDANDNTNYVLSTGLSWYAGANSARAAHGTFTVDADSTFTVTSELDETTATSDWDGSKLTKQGAGTLILSGDNDYSGGTTINEGTLVAASTTALGTGLVDNNATLVLDADGEVSAAGGITTHSGATTQLALGTSLDLGDSALIQEDGSTLNVELNSDSVQPLITGGSATLGGDLVVSDASLQARASDAEFQSFKLMDMDSDISGDFTSLTMNLTDQPDYLTVTGTINPADASEYLLTEGLSWNATATSATPAHGSFTLGAGDSFEVTSVLGDKTGNGDWDGKTLTKLGAGKLTLSGANTYSGDTNVQEGTLWLSGDGTIGEMGSQQAVNVASGATFGGSNGTTVNGKVTNEGTLVFGDSEETGAIFTLNGDLINMGTMTSGSSSSTPGNTLYVDGNYTGNGGSLYLNTVLGDDDSATDKLVITGDASGTTDLYINGIGDGAQTTNGIEVVDVGGVSTSDAFVLKNEVNASLYTYRLYWNESDNDWYLASKAQSDDDDSGGDDTPSDGGDDGGNVTPPDDGGDVAPQYRADIGAYMGNQWMARNLQMQTLYDREGSQYRNADGSVWARFKAGKAESEAVSGNIDMDSNYSQFQLGGDILAWGNGQQSFTVGVMASYINADTDSTGNRGADGSQFTSSGNVDGYNLGVYATWFADAQTHSGAYVDSWYQYGFYNNSVESGDAGSESYDSTANAVSLETGYRYDIALSNGNTVSLTPQAQVVWQNYSADSVKDNYGTRIDGQDGDSWTTRLGLRVDGKLYKGSRTVIQPFAEANWLHTSDDVSVSFDDATVKQDLPANRAELKVGLQADIDKQWSVRAQVAGQTGSNDFGDLNGSLNLRYNW